MKGYQFSIKLKSSWPLFLLLTVFILAALPTAARAAEKDVVIEAMTDELNRSMKSLQIENMEKPYYLEYTVVDKQAVDITAVFGSLTGSDENHNRSLRVDLRVGDYQLDNTAFIGTRSMFSSGSGVPVPIATEDDYDAVRHDIWLATDDVYKNALEQLATKKGFIKNQAQTENIPDFSKEKATQSIEPVITLKIDRAKWETLVKNLSAIFQKFPAINDSGIEFQVKILNKYYVNSEGSVFRQPETEAALMAYASTQAPDGMKLKYHIPFFATTVDGLPNEKDMAAGIKKMAEELTALANAPVMEEYIGPVLFTGQASAELFAQVLAPHLSGERPPLAEDARMAQLQASSKLASRLNRRVLPRDISIVDDPTRTEFQKHPLLGAYKIDDQGIPAQPVKLVERGVLKSLLMSRRPRKEITNSNGHARAGENGKPSAEIGNLFITAEKGQSYDQLKKELIQLCKDQQMPFGLIVKTVDNPTISGVDLSISSFLVRSGSNEPQMTSPVMLYKVYAKDGREELVRGVSISELTVRSLKDIFAVGNDGYLLNRMLNGSGSSTASLYAILNGQSSRADGLPCSIVAPSVLFEELEFKKDSGGQKNPPLLVHPFFR